MEKEKEYSTNQLTNPRVIDESDSLTQLAMVAWDKSEVQKNTSHQRFAANIQMEPTSYTDMFEDREMDEVDANKYELNMKKMEFVDPHIGERYIAESFLPDIPVTLRTYLLVCSIMYVFTIFWDYLFKKDVFWTLFPVRASFLGISILAQLVPQWLGKDVKRTSILSAILFVFPSLGFTIATFLSKSPMDAGLSFAVFELATILGVVDSFRQILNLLNFVVATSLFSVDFCVPDNSTIQCYFTSAISVIQTINLMIMCQASNMVMKSNFRTMLLLQDQENWLKKAMNASNELIGKMLPQKVVDALWERQEEASITERFKAATVMFFVVDGFADMAKDNSPQKTVELLNHIHDEVSILCTKYGITKLKTIGNMFMVVTGVPVPQKNHQAIMLDFVLELQSSLKTENMTISGGVHSGSIVGGVIGTTRLMYDIWGAVVNTASRLQSSALPNTIQLSSETSIAVNQTHEVEERGFVDLKGLGECKVWILTGKKRTLEISEEEEEIVIPTSKLDKLNRLKRTLSKGRSGADNTSSRRSSISSIHSMDMTMKHAREKDLAEILEVDKNTETEKKILDYSKSYFTQIVGLLSMYMDFIDEILFEGDNAIVLRRAFSTYSLIHDVVISTLIYLQTQGDITFTILVYGVALPIKFILYAILQSPVGGKTNKRVTVLLALMQMWHVFAYLAIASSLDSRFTEVIPLLFFTYIANHHACLRLGPIYVFFTGILCFLMVVLVSLLRGHYEMAGYIVAIYLTTEVFDHGFSRLVLAKFWATKFADVTVARTGRKKERSDKIVHDIFPDTVISRFRSQKVIADQFSHVSTVYLDICGFTVFCGKQPAGVVVAMLNGLFNRFDEIVSENECIQKVITVGDAYVITVGVSAQAPNHALIAVRTAEKMMENVKKFNTDSMFPEMKVRIGVHTGEAIAGVVGFTYDVWGPGPTGAHVMEQTGVPGRIHISQSTYDEVKNEVKCVPHNDLEIQPNQLMKSYLVEN